MLNEGRIFHQGSRDEIFHAGALESIYEMKIRIERTGTGTEYVLPGYEQ